MEASLSRGGGDDDVVEADGADDAGADLLVAAAEDVALAAYDGDDDPRVRAVDQVEDLALARVGGEETAVPHDVDAEQGGRQSQLVHDGGDGAARAHDVRDAGLHDRGDCDGEGPDSALAGLHAAVLGGLEAPGIVGHAQVAVETGCGDAPARGLLVDVHHLGHAGCACAVAQECEGRAACLARGCAEDGRVYLHAGGDAEHGDGVAAGGV